MHGSDSPNLMSGGVEHLNKERLKVKGWASQKQTIQSRGGDIICQGRI